MKKLKIFFHSTLIKMPLGNEVGLGPGHIVLDGDPAPTAAPPHFRHMLIVAKLSPIWATAEPLLKIGQYLA